VRTINEDEFLILSHVEQAKADLEKIIEQIKSKGDITDDLSLLKIEFLPAGKTEDSIHDEEVVKPVVLIDDYDDLPATNSAEYNELLEEGRRLVRAGKSAEALAKLEKAYKMRQDDPALNKILAVLTFREKEYEKAVEILENYLKHDPNIEDFWLYLSIAHKRMGNLERSLEAAEKVFEINSQRVPNLLQLADLHLRMGHTGRAKIFLEQVFQIDPNNSQGKTLEEKIARMAADPGRKA
jgi:tetratricopeptide (TPR) repeat protein